MGLPFRFSAGEGPVVEQPVRTREDVARLRTDSAADLGYVAEAVRLVALWGQTPGHRILRRSLHACQLHDRGRRFASLHENEDHDAHGPWLFDELLAKIVTVTAEYATEQVRAGGDVIQVFDSWVGCLSPRDYRQHVLPRTLDLVRKLKKTGAPVIYFGTDTATLLSAMQETGADVIGLDWRVPLDEGWADLEDRGGYRVIWIPSFFSQTGSRWKLARAMF